MRGIDVTCRGVLNVMCRGALGALWILCGVACGDADANGSAARDAGALGGDSGEPDAGSTSVPHSMPVADAYEALTAGALDEAEQVTLALDDALEANPEDGWGHLFAGLMRFWQLAEGDFEGVVDMAPLALPALENLEQARALLPDDPRVPAFQGLVRVRVGLTLNDDALVQSGFDDLDVGIAGLPAFAYFLRVSAADGTAADSAHYAGVFDDVEAVLEHCAYERDAHGRYQYPEGDLGNDRRVCNNEGIVPHVWEGLFITFGDAALKSGKGVEDARALYESAKAAPNYADWPFAAQLDARLDGLDARAAAYADADTGNDPKVWTDDGHVCTGCHQER